jgi:predicted amidophosphoribosyltransferase
MREKNIQNALCSVCDQVFHAVCGGYREDSEGFGQNVICSLCVGKNRINIQREGAKSGQKEQAHKMVSLFNSRLPAVYIGINVVVRVPDVDR